MRLLFVLLFLSSIVVSCKKKQQSEPIPVLTKWEALTGTYNVYDTTGVFLYEMELSRLNETDTLKIKNFDGEFDLLEKQLNSPTYPYAFTIWYHEEIVDTNGNRWNIMGYGTDQMYNNLVNDTILMFFQKQNMPYWLNDATPYFNGNLKHIAVKQH